MAKTELKFSTSYEKKDFEPVTLSDGTVVKMNGVIDGDKKSISGEAEKDGKQVGLMRMSPDSGRLFIQVQPMAEVTTAVAIEIVETFSAGISLFNK